MTRALRVCALAAALLAWSLPAAAEIEGIPDYTGKRIAAVQVVGPATAGNLAELTRFLEIRKGDTYSPRQVRRTVEVLAKLGNYSRIEVEAIETVEGLVLTVRLEPVPKIKKVVIKGVRGSKQRVNNALGVTPGDLYRGPAALEQMRDDLVHVYRSAGWPDVEVAVTALPAPEGDVILDVNLQEGRRSRIRGVEFRGDDWQDAFDEETLVEESGLEVEEPATDTALAKAAERLVRYAVKLGFLEARVRQAFYQRDERTGDRTAVFTFLPGERIKIEFDKKAIALDDQKRHPLWFWDFRDQSLLDVLELDEESHFTTGFAQEAAERLELYYQRRGYLETEVTPAFAVDKAKRTKTFTFKIRPGRRFRLKRVSFRGTEKLPEEVQPKALLREFYGLSKALEDHHYVPDDVDASLYHVTNYIRSKGFDRARIEAEEPAIDRNKRTVVLEYDITPGPRSIVGAVTFSGNKEAPESKLRKVIAQDPVGIVEGAPLNGVYLDRADVALEEYYASIGFPYADARHELSLRAPEATPERETAPTPTPEPAPSGGTNGSAGTNGATSTDGTHTASGNGAEPPAPPPDQRIVDVAYTIDESIQAYIGRVIVRGNRYTKREAIERVLPFKTGETYTPQALAAGQDAVYKLGPFARVSVVPTEQGEPERVRDIMVAVAEANRIVVEPSLGVSLPDEGPRVGVRAQHRNLFGSGESLSLRAQANWRWEGLLGETEGVTKAAPAVDYNQIEERVLLTYAQPTTFGFPVSGSVTASLFEREQNRAFGYIGNRMVGAADQRVELALPVLQRSDVRLVGRYQMFLRDIQYESKSQENAVAVVKEDFQFPAGEMFVYPLKWKIASASLGALVDARNDRVNPTDGYTLTFNGEVADEWIASDADFVRVLAAWSLFRPAPWKFNVALSMRGGYARPLGRSRGVPVDQRFHLGGTGSVRGFHESEIGPRFDRLPVVDWEPGEPWPRGEANGSPLRNVSTGGDVGGSYTLEFRHKLFAAFDWVFFTDGGWSRLQYREPDPDGVKRGELRNPDTLATSIGLGLRVKTPLGPMKLDLAVDTARIERLNSINGVRDNVLFHFTIGDF